MARFYKRARKTSRGPRRFIAKRRVRKPRTRGVFRKKVLSVIRSEAENKTNWVGATNLNYNGVINSNAEFYQLVPTIGQGTDTNQRIGDKLKGMYLEVKGHIQANWDFTDDASRRIVVRLMVVSSKVGSSGQYGFTANWELDRLLLNSGSEQQFVGDIPSLYYPINRKVVTVHYDRLHYLEMPKYYSASGVGSGPITSTRMFTIRIPCRKQMNFINGSDRIVNFDPRITLGYAHTDGAATADTASTQVQLNYMSKFVYEDM